MGAGTSALSQIESRGAGPPSGVGGLEHGPDPSLAAGRVRLWGVRCLGLVSTAALLLIVNARLTGNVRDRKFTRKGLGSNQQELLPPPPPAPAQPGLQ